MDNSSTIGYALIAGFIVYITVRGELPAYLCVVGLGNGCPSPPADVPVTGSTTSKPINTTSVITAPGNPGGNPGGTQSTIDYVPFPSAPGWQLPELPAPTFPTAPSGGNGSSTISTFFCEDPFGNPIDCADQVDYGLCYNEFGSLVNCD